MESNQLCFGEPHEGRGEWVQGLDQCFSAFVMLRPFNITPYVVVDPNRKIISIATS